MFFPQPVLYCIQVLEDAGFPAYAVGGCVRDSLLGRTPHDYDLCTAATPQQICRLFSGHSLVRSGEKHGTVGVVLEHQVYEITTFRTEGAYRDSRHPDWVRFVTDIESDLSRRDFTVNAMACSPTRGLIDPFGGRQDLENRVLRAVGDPWARFREDSLRILRGVRFAVRYGLTPERQTLQAMLETAPAMDLLARERVFDELCKLLPLVSGQALLDFAPILTQVIPELQPCIGFLQHNPHHLHDVYTHTACVVESAGPDLALRWAALLHDVGKPVTFTLDENGIGHFYGHAQVSARMADQILLRLKAPTALRKQVTALIERHMTPLEPDKRLLRRRLSQLGPELTDRLLQLQRADLGGKGSAETDAFGEVSRLLEQIRAENSCLNLRDLAINGHDLMALGLAGPAIGRTLNLLLQQVLDEQLENRRDALLQAAVIIKEQRR